MKKLVIVLEGGLVQSVHSDDKLVQVAILDYDVFGDNDPKLDLDNFFLPEIDPDLTVLKRWEQKKAEFLAGSLHTKEG
jgi:hypothetical protein